ncbi:histidine kinase/response regulator hybrid protein [Xanthomonas arboricola pv. juglandis]|jgi:signal transduction histidine kinase|uniref:ATP-binding response regulator n=1 Tax=Xanthomonas TaxID=338 RepID=UPI000E5B06F6|nr:MULTISPECIES: hybrid sensor histidine kinase/response regulator [Xanthomonas]SYZ55945.1 histidine kinase/response regulator hybrid protein [Xanthomonas arboricola pv. juglandis]MBB3778106.1 signal transduction histidine kinase [Xanthomonas euroxanthea]MBB3812543.1 signal transduction histidine kinase [Xanthomonas euroxanthea]MBB5766843.1 signal transduction histidine kinase [Xanthomonas euroxanthea]NIK40169.1 signal transduction histidine kinase [Xanthomonas euroxanthea]
MLHEGGKLEQLKILLVEDSPEDAELLSDQLLDAGLDAAFERVDSEPSLRAALDAFQPDIVLSDLSMPGFSGHQALRLVRQNGATPFIFVSGTMGEETAVKALQDGANDYIIKHNPTRLPSAVIRAIREARADLERQRVESELMRAQRLESLAMLAAGLSHDLRNILQPLLIVPDLLAGRTDDPQLRQLANVVAECGRRGHEMAESMLSFVRGSNKPREQVSIASLFQAVQMLLKSSLPDGVRLQMDTIPLDLTIEANYTELQQCLLNLGLNAIQAMPGGGMLTLSADRHDGTRVRMSVADTGVGMSDDTRARLFSPFFTTKADGTGLGLISCKRIVESYGGSIVVDSRLGEGTRFDMIVPMRAAAVTVADTEPPLALGHGQRVLLVDGEATRLSLLGNALSSQGYQPQLASDGAAALQLVQQHAMPDLVIIDSDIIQLSAVSVLLSMQELGYHGPAIVLEDVGAPLQRSYFPPDIPVHVLRKPLEMRRVFRAVAHALEVA